MFEGAERVEGGAGHLQVGVQGWRAEGTRPCQQGQGAPAGDPHQDQQQSHPLGRKRRIEQTVGEITRAAELQESNPDA